MSRATRPDRPDRADRASRASRPAAAELLVVGGEPRVDLLPPEVRKERAARVIRRRLGLAVIGVFVLVVLGVAGASAFALQSQLQLAEAQARTGELLGEQLQYVEVRAVQNQVDLVKAAQQVGASTEIDWKAYLEKVKATLPASVSIDTISVDTASPMEAFAQSTAPLQGARVATISFTATSASLPDVPTWLTALKGLPGYADALPTSVTVDEAGINTVSITMHVNSAAFSQRFAEEK
jgi:Tfp pilus assembly protein PilN